MSSKLQLQLPEKTYKSWVEGQEDNTPCLDQGLPSGKDDAESQRGQQEMVQLSFSFLKY